MKTIRNGEVWFSSMDEALANAAAPTCHSSRRQPNLALAYRFVGLGTLALASWAVLEQLGGLGIFRR